MRKVTALTPDLFESWSLLFEATGHACFCRYWHFKGTKNEWLARAAFEGGVNRAEAHDLLVGGDETARGVVLLEDCANGAPPRVIGWMKLVPLRAAPKLRGLPVYRALPLDGDEAAFAVACLLVHPEARSSGAASALVAGAEPFVRQWGGTSIVAFPYRCTERQHDDVLLMGPESAFIAAGFTCEIDRPPYPVFRKVIPSAEKSAG